MRSRLTRFFVVLAACAASTALPQRALADHSQESIFQDDTYLLYSNTATVQRTLATLAALGVQRVRATVQWSFVAPDPTSRTAPRGFNPGDSADYGPGAWAPYDRLVELAASYHIGVFFTVTAPGPLWAMSPGARTAKAADHWAPDPFQFLLFMYAVGTRYSGSYRGSGGALLPRVSYWSVWNEPNQPAWLAPQWRSYHGKEVLYSPALYREYVQAAVQALLDSGHLSGHDTVLVGELAPEGVGTPGFYNSTTPMPFVRALYCVDARYRPLRGSSAAALGCPTGGSRKQFVQDNPGLFYATGFAHHPYYFHHSPDTSAPDPDYVPISDLSRLERALDRIFSSYGVHRQIPLYLTEYGYQTNPPNPYQVVTPAEQAPYLNESDYMAWRDPRVRSVAQFLLRDSGPDNRYSPANPSYWDTFQTGLEYVTGKRKPAYTAYRVPIWIPSTHVKRGKRLFVWGEVRPAWNINRAPVMVQWRGTRGGFRTIATIRTGSHGYLVAHVRLMASGTIRIAWLAPTGALQSSRGVSVRVG